ncbi:MAG: GNAT family N-acetyltransferase [Deltaproteobacteria bacterium]|nr:GNAT family N-acetyltransferase [Deltaproteobacteria bacterium]
MVRILSVRDLDALRELLGDDPVCNLFLLGWLTSTPFHRAPWYGFFDLDQLRAVALVVDGRLAVPWAPEAADARPIGERLREDRLEPGMIVGPRAACDELWDGWDPRYTPRLRYDQRLYTLARVPEAPLEAGFRLAAAADQPRLLLPSARMEEEDLGRNPMLHDPVQHDTIVRDRIRARRTWVIEREGEIVFHINVGTQLPHACQVGGTYVPPAWRGRGLASAGMRALARAILLGRAPELSRMLTLHVNEANLPAVRCYEQAGFERSIPFRLIAAT